MSIYKDCDIRGVYGKELTGGDAYRIGRAVGTAMTDSRLVVGGDVRVSTPELKEALVRGLLDSGADVLDIGLTPTPVFYFAIGHLEAAGGVMVTASHNPARYNGFKLMLGEMPVTPEDIAGIGEIVASGAFAQGRGKLDKTSVEEAYRRAVGGLAGPSHLRVVVDAGNGAVSELAPRMASDRGCEVVPLFCRFDGSFPNREPNPAVPENLEQVRRIVLERRADLGAAFDGDGDRVAFIDERGEIVTSEQSLCIFMEHGIESGDSVVYDQKASAAVAKTAQQLGIRPIMERSGHAFIKRTFLLEGSAMAGEVSGHFFFRELGHDDGIYAMLKMCALLSADGRPLSRIAEDVPKSLITPDIRLQWPYSLQDALLRDISSLGKRHAVTRLDGIRVEFPRGWLLARKSVTEEGVTLRIEADDGQAMRSIVCELLQAAPALRGKHPLLDER